MVEKNFIFLMSNINKIRSFSRIAYKKIINNFYLTFLEWPKNVTLITYKNEPVLMNFTYVTYGFAPTTRINKKK